MLTKFDRKQLELMKKSISSFEEKEMDLDGLLRLTQSLEELMDSLQSIDKAWKDEFRLEWGELEIRSSIMISEDIEDFIEEEKIIIATAIQNIKALIDQILKENPISNDDPSGEEVTRTTESDKKQIQMMKQCLHSFDQANLNLDSLTKTSKSLKELLDSLESVNNKWKKTFRSEWWILAFVYETTIDQKRSALSHEDKEKVLNASANMKKMIDDVLSTGRYV